MVQTKNALVEQRQSFIFVDARGVLTDDDGDFVRERVKWLNHISLALNKAQVVLLHSWETTVGNLEMMAEVFGDRYDIAGWAGSVSIGGDIRDYLREVKIPRRLIILSCDDSVSEFLPQLIAIDPEIGLCAGHTSKSIAKMLEQKFTNY